MPEGLYGQTVYRKKTMSLVEYEVQSLRIQVVMRTHALGEWMLHALGNLNNMGAVASATESLEGSRATKVVFDHRIFTSGCFSY